jgi:hypothetical protein
VDQKESYEIVGLGPAARGWRAIYSTGGSGFRLAPLVSWGVFHKTVRQESSGEVVADLGNVLEGVVADSQPGGPIRGFSCAADASNFEGYLDPETPDPTH